MRFVCLMLVWGHLSLSRCSPGANSTMYSNVSVACMQCERCQPGGKYQPWTPELEECFRCTSPKARILRASQQPTWTFNGRRWKQSPSYYIKSVEVMHKYLLILQTFLNRFWAVGHYNSGHWELIGCHSGHFVLIGCELQLHFSSRAPYEPVHSRL